MSLPAIFDKLRLPVIASPLFIISGPELVIAQCKAGIVGSFPALNARPASVFDEWLHQITEELAAHNRDNPDRPAAPYRGQPDRPPLKQPAGRRYLRSAPSGRCRVTITSLGAREDREQRRPWLGRYHPARRDR
jgi:nitronate monooxygenase